ncbi:Mitochondrial outer membrane protein porin of 36 kDa [Capsicum chinense]|nr:Mitochondrial outer membrane protein porin of 36 kDa [Capsicum chinense]
MYLSVFDSSNNASACDCSIEGAKGEAVADVHYSQERNVPRPFYVGRSENVVWVRGIAKAIANGTIVWEMKAIPIDWGMNSSEVFHVLPIAEYNRRLETDSLSHMTIVSKVQKSLADLEVLHSTGSGANLFIPTVVCQNSQNKLFTTTILDEASPGLKTILSFRVLDQWSGKLLLQWLVTVAIDEIGIAISQKITVAIGQAMATVVTVAIDENKRLNKSKNNRCHRSSYGDGCLKPSPLLDLWRRFRQPSHKPLPLTYRNVHL